MKSTIQRFWGTPMTVEPPKSSQILPLLRWIPWQIPKGRPILWDRPAVDPAKCRKFFSVDDLHRSAPPTFMNGSPFFEMGEKTNMAIFHDQMGINHGIFRKTWGIPNGNFS